MKYYRLQYDLYDPSESTESDKYMAEISTFPGCIAWGDTPEETLETLESVVAATIETYIEEGWDLPEEVSNSVLLFEKTSSWFRYDLQGTYPEAEETRL